MSAQFILKQPMTSAYCLACQGCCRFKEANSPWRPKVYFGEEQIFGGDTLSSDIFDDKRCIKTKTIGEEHFCGLLDIKTNKCTAYLNRPLECRLYPFLLVRKQGEIFLAVHLACPFVQESKDSKEFESQCQELKIFFAQEKMNDFLKKNVEHIFSGYILKNEIEVVCPVCAS